MPDTPRDDSNFFRALEAALGGPGGHEAALALLVDELDVESGTVHLLAEDGLLHLAAQRNIPPGVLERIQGIPIGKGMAGLAAERREPVSLCNLQTDTSGDARPGARATGLRGSVAVPILAGQGPDAKAVGALGVGTADERTFDERETELLLETGRRIAARLQGA